MYRIHIKCFCLCQPTPIRAKNIVILCIIRINSPHKPSIVNPSAYIKSITNPFVFKKYIVFYYIFINRHNYYLILLYLYIERILHD